MSAGRKNNSPTKHWNTPPKIVSAVKDFFGGRIDLDPCSNEHSMVGAKVSFGKPHGLTQDWFGRVFCNPPYGRNSEDGTSLLDWTNKAAETFLARNNEIIMLLPVATNTRHFYRIWETAQNICFLKDSRLKFWIDGKEDKKGAPMACCLVYWGREDEKFLRDFAVLGKCVVL
jgi:hypothetical protein